MSEATRRKWARAVEALARSGLTAEEFARGQALSVRTLRWWRWRLAREAGRAPGPSFVELVPVEPAEARGPEPEPEPGRVGTEGARPGEELVVVRGPWRVAVSKGFDDDTLRRVLRVVGER